MRIRDNISCIFVNIIMVKYYMILFYQMIVNNFVEFCKKHYFMMWIQVIVVIKFLIYVDFGKEIIEEMQKLKRVKGIV